METDGGGWMLTYAYNHDADKNDPLNPDTIPLDPSSGYSHVNLNAINGYTVDDVEEVRLYCQTSNHNRIVHFKTSNDVIKGMAFSGSQKDNRASNWNTGFTPLDGHSGNLPAWANGGLTSSSGGLWEVPLYKAYKYDWSVRGQGKRWECDDYYSSLSDANSHSTVHLVYVRVSTRVTFSMPPTEAPTPSPVESTYSNESKKKCWWWWC